MEGSLTFQRAEIWWILSTTGREVRRDIEARTIASVGWWAAPNVLEHDRCLIAARSRSLTVNGGH